MDVLYCDVDIAEKRRVHGGGEATQVRAGDVRADNGQANVACIVKEALGTDAHQSRSVGAL